MADRDLCRPLRELQPEDLSDPLVAERVLNRLIASLEETAEAWAEEPVEDALNEFELQPSDFWDAAQRLLEARDGDGDEVPERVYDAFEATDGNVWRVIYDGEGSSAALDLLREWSEPGSEEG